VAESNDPPKVSAEDLINEEKKNKLAEERLNLLEKEIAAYKEAIKDEKNLYKQQSARNSLREAENELQRKSLENIRQKIVQNTELNKKDKKILEDLGIQGDTHDANLKKIEKQLDVLDLQSEAQSELNTKLTEQGSLAVKAQKSAALIGEAYGQGKLALLAMNSASKMLDTGLSKYINSIKSIVLGVNEAQKGFERATASIFGPSVSKQVQATYKELNIYGVSAKQAYDAQLGLSRVVTDFTTYNPTLQGELRKSSLLFEELGVSQDSYFKGMQSAIKFFSMTPLEADKASREILATSKALGVVPADMMEQYGRLGPTLAKFGSDGQKTFKDLARIQKQTGFEMEKILQITNRFDTFEGAAQQAGQLNAALGGNFVNAMDLMMATDPAERFDMIRQALEQTGLSFDEMSYYQKEFYKNSLGLSDVGELAMIMSGDMDAFGDSTNKTAAQHKEMAETAKSVQSVMEAFQSVIANNADGFIKIAGAVEKFTKFMLDNGEIIQYVTYYLMAAKAASILYRSAIVGVNVARATGNALSKTGTFLSKIFTAAKMKETAVEKASVGPKNAANKAQQLSNKSTKAGIGPMLSFALAVGAVAAGIGLAAVGMALLIGAVDEASFGAVAGASVIFIGIGTGAYFMAGGLAAAAVKAGVAGTALLPLGGAIALVGLGVGLAAAGMAELVKSFNGFDATEIVAIGAAMLGFSVSLYAVAAAIAAFANPLTAGGAAVLAGVGVAIGGLAYAFGKFKGKDDGIDDLIPVMQSVGNISQGQFELAQKTFESIKKSINATEVNKMEGLGNLFGDIHIHYIQTATRVSSGAATRDNATGNNRSSAESISLSVDTPIHIDIGGRPLDKYILKLVSESETSEMRAAVQKQGVTP